MVRLIPLLTLLLIAGCAENDTEFEPDPVEPVFQAEDGHATFDYMVDAAVLADMTVADYHFAPRRAILTPLGQQRIGRLADIIDQYGGTVRFNTRETDDSLINQRVSAITAALQENGLDLANSQVELNIPGSVGMDAREAILIRTYENVYSPGQSQSSGAGSTGMPPMNN